MEVREFYCRLNGLKEQERRREREKKGRDKEKERERKGMTNPFVARERESKMCERERE